MSHSLSHNLLTKKQPPVVWAQMRSQFRQSWMFCLNGGILLLVTQVTLSLTFRLAIQHLMRCTRLVPCPRDWRATPAGVYGIPPVEVYDLLPWSPPQAQAQDVPVSCEGLTYESEGKGGTCPCRLQFFCKTAGHHPVQGYGFASGFEVFSWTCSLIFGYTRWSVGQNQKIYSAASSWEKCTTCWCCPSRCCVDCRCNGFAAEFISCSPHIWRTGLKPSSSWWHLPSAHMDPEWILFAIATLISASSQVSMQSALHQVACW